MIQLILFGIICVLITCFILKWGTRNFDYFLKKGLKFKKPYPVIGTNTWFFYRTSLPELTKFNYGLYPNEKLFGIFDFTTPIFYLRDPQLIKTLTIKDFDHFVDHKKFIDIEDEFFQSTLPSMTGKRWREMRNSLSPAFTSSKMRMMFELISFCGQEMVQYFCEDFEKNGLQMYDMKDIFSKFTNDVIATCAFGLKCNSLKDPNNEFFLIGKSVMDIRRPSVLIKMFTLRFLPKLSKLLNIKIFDGKIRNRFVEMIIDTMEQRRKEGIVRPDMINILMQLKDGSLKKTDEVENDSIATVPEDTTNRSVTNVKSSWSDDQLIAQSFVFFLAGFDSSSTVMQFIAYELAINSDVQTKLIHEIDEIHEGLTDKLLTYDALQKMKYLDMVISETLRKWPPGIVTDRLCVKDYEYEDDDGLKFTIEKGSSIFIPIYGLHMDEKYFPEPNKFDPDRFSDKNSGKANMNAYLPFGIGPRSCIASRFALMETKAVIYYLLLNFTFEVCGKTQVPIKLKNTLLGLVPDEKIQLHLKPRNKHKVYYLSDT